MKIKDAPPIVKIAFMSLITVIIWITFDVYRALTVEPSPEVSEEVLRGLSPALDVTALNQLQNRVYVSDEQIRDINIVPKNTFEESLSILEQLSLTPPEQAEQTGGQALIEEELATQSAETQP
jgi:hypothetical protein